MSLKNAILESKIQNTLTDFFNKDIYKNKYFFIDFYSITHIFFGGFVNYFLTRNGQHGIRKYVNLIIILLLWEIFELYMASYTFFFLLDSSINILWDMIFGILGALIFEALNKRKTKNFKKQ